MRVNPGYLRLTPHVSTSTPNPVDGCLCRVALPPCPGGLCRRQERPCRRSTGNPTFARGRRLCGCGDDSPEGFVGRERGQVHSRWFRTHGSIRGLPEGT